MEGKLRSVLVIQSLFFWKATLCQQLPFDEHYYSTRPNQGKPNDLNYDGKRFSNGTYATDGNITEFYSPDVYGQRAQKRGFGSGSPGTQYGDNQFGTGPTNNAIGPFPPSSPNQKAQFNLDQQAGSNQNYYGPMNRNDESGIRRDSTVSSYRPSDPGQQSPPLTNVPYTNYNPTRDPYPKTVPNFTNYTDPWYNPDERRNANYQDPYRYPGSVGTGDNRQSQIPIQQSNFSSRYPGGGPGDSRPFETPIQQPSPNYYPTNSLGPAAYPGQMGGSRNWNYQPPNRGAAFDPGDPHRNFWNEPWSTTTFRPVAPGVLGGWRSELQGKQRLDDLHKIPEAVFVQTTHGRVQGFKVKLYDGPGVPLPIRPGSSTLDRVQGVVSSFVGIPYAKPPTNDGRFRPPRPHPGWQLHQAIEFGPACPQPARYFGYTAGIVQVSEDCLYLNVYSPDVGSGFPGSPFPVLFYIHDGDFIHGGSQTFPPHQLVGFYKVVVVTVNFRLGALGFLSTADEFSPGNYGMLDLSLALKWVHSTIRSFNGDPERITVVGLGSGAAAAGLLMLSPRTRGYVRNVVALEGAPTADWAAINDQYRLQNTTQLFALKLGCWNEWDTASWTMIQCLRARSWQELANLELDPDVGMFPWSPAVDREFKVPINSPEPEWSEENWRFLPDTPEQLLKRGDYPYVKYMTGSSRQAAGDLLYDNKTLAPNFLVTREWFDQMIHRWVKKYNYTLNPEGVFSAIRYAYTYWPDPLNTTHLREEYIQFLSDALYRSPIDQTVKLLLARGIQVHSFILNYTLEGLHLPEWRETTRNLGYYLLAGAPFMDSEFIPERLRVDRSTWTEGDRNMSQFLIESVANMAHYGSPTPREILGVYWERATPADLKYLALNGTNNSTMRRNYRQRELTFWTEYLPFVVGRYVPTYPPTTEYWWEPNEPLQIAFWSVSGICLILIVMVVACCLLWRTAKKQRDRVYQDYGPGNRPLSVVGAGDELLSDYAPSVKTVDSIDSGVKLSHNPNPQSEHHPLFQQPGIHVNPGAISQATLTTSSRDRYPIPKRSLRTPDSAQTQV